MHKFRLRRLRGWPAVLFSLVFLVLAFSQTQSWLGNTAKTAVSSQPGLYKVSRFVDGDTIAVNMNGKTEKIRMIGVDTPETHKPNTPVQCYGPAAAAFTKNTLQNREFKLVSDSLSTDRDRYNRLLRYVVLTDGTNFNKLLITEGYGFYYPYFPFTKSNEFSLAQESTKSASRGIWGNCQPTPTDNGGWVSNPA